MLAVQKRLDDLNFWPLDEITGYYGETTQAVVKEFQNANGITDASGTCDEKTLTILFSQSAIERPTPAREKATEPAATPHGAQRGSERYPPELSRAAVVGSFVSMAVISWLPRTRRGG